ncbi:MAG: DEAD/DEAH box helicase [Bacteroidales bacterium]
MLFESLPLIKPIAKSLQEEGYVNPTPIQAEAIPIILEGSDILGCAQTGTGKTAAFAIPIIQLLSERTVFQKKKAIRSLILTPTRELAIQIDESFKTYGKYTNIETTVIFGGVNQLSQTKRLRAGVDVLIATPGRLLDLIQQGFISLREVEFFVLDEADRMLDMGFIHDIKKLLPLLPKKRQSLFFSATMPPAIVKLANTILNKPKQVSVTPVSSTVEIIDQYMYFVDRGNKNALLLDILQKNDMDSVLVFTRTKHGADKVVKYLNKNNITALAIHGNKSQNARQKALQNFKDQTTQVLVATDIAARGIDVDSLGYVINYEISNVAETYVHRIGRTGRAGGEGTALSFCDAEEKAYVRDIEKLIGKKIPVVTEHPFPLTDHNPEKKVQQQRSKKTGKPSYKKSGTSSNHKSDTKKPYRKRY